MFGFEKKIEIKERNEGVFTEKTQTHTRFFDNVVYHAIS